jgi:hypothetical protein
MLRAGFRRQYNEAALSSKGGQYPVREYPMSTISGKLVIIAVVIVAVAAAGTSWWFRYSSTYRAAEFWGPEAAQLIRDAPIIELCRCRRRTKPALPHMSYLGYRLTDCHDISAMPGHTHLRYALLEDRSFIWPPHATSKNWKWLLRFRNQNRSKEARLFLTSDWKLVAADGDKALSCEPIADGLREMFAGLTEMSTENVDATSE